MSYQAMWAAAQSGCRARDALCPRRGAALLLAAARGLCSACLLQLLPARAALTEIETAYASGMADRAEVEKVRSVRDRAAAACAP